MTMCTNAPTDLNSQDFKEFVADLWALWFSVGLTARQHQKLITALSAVMVHSTDMDYWDSGPFSQLFAFYDENTRSLVREQWRYWQETTISLEQALHLRNIQFKPNEYQQQAQAQLSLCRGLLFMQKLIGNVKEKDILTAASEMGQFTKMAVTQATTLSNIKPADVKFANFLLFEDIGFYSGRWTVTPFEGFSHHHAFTKENWIKSKTKFPELAAMQQFTQFVDDKEFSKNFLLANCTQQLGMWLANFSQITREKRTTPRMVFHIGDALEFCDEMLKESKAVRFDAIHTSLPDDLGLLPILLCCSPLLKENGALSTFSNDSFQHFRDDREYIEQSAVVPPSILPSLVGLRCVGFEGAAKPDSSAYTENPRFPGTYNEDEDTQRHNRPFVWKKAPHNLRGSPETRVALTDSVAEAIYNLMQHYVFSSAFFGHGESPFPRVMCTPVTVVRVMVNLMATSHVTDWSLLTKRLRGDSQMEPYLRDFQNILNIQQLNVKILSFTEVGEQGLLPLNWEKPTARFFATFLYIKVNKKRHYLHCFKIIYDYIKIPELLHFIVPYSLVDSNGKLVLTIFDLDENKRVHKQKYDLNDALLVAKLHKMPWLVGGPSPQIAPKTTKENFTLVSFSEDISHFDLELQIAPTLLGENNVTLDRVDTHKLTLNLPKHKITFPLVFASGVNYGKSKVKVARKRATVILEIVKGYPFGHSRYHNFTNLLAYPYLELPEEECDRFAYAQYTKKELKKHSTSLQAVKQAIGGFLDTTHSLRILQRIETPDSTTLKEILGYSYPHGIRMSVQNGAVMADLSFSFDTSTDHHDYWYANVEEVKCLALVNETCALFRKILEDNLSRTPKLPARPEVFPVRMLYHRTFLALLYPVKAGQPASPTMVHSPEMPAQPYPYNPIQSHQSNLERLVEIYNRGRKNPLSIEEFIEEVARNPALEHKISQDPGVQKMMNKANSDPENFFFPPDIMEHFQRMGLDPYDLPNFHKLPKKETAAPKKAAAPSKETTAPKKESAPNKETTAPKKDAVAPNKETTGPKKESTKPKKACVICGKSPAKKCSQCLAVSYCSAQCQKSDWKAHKPICKKVAGKT
eukprot:Phypoly_transcript_00776.p1 GENE.Phypoly_transcript_00776~~Phypoly_transcript_00776.p1  ORF type:complete len:1096 (+),score=143.53 Phypoly_transcript_00776:29-3289(+)